MKKILSILLFTIHFTFLSLAQYPPMELSIGTVTSGTTGTVNVPVMAGTNFQNIVHLSGTFTFNPSVLSWNSMQNWGLSNPSGASFVLSGPGLISFNWSNLISVGPTLSAGSVIFNLQFNIIGVSGQSSPIGFVGAPQALSWNNGFGWSGSNFTVTNGLVNIGCAGTNPNFNAVANFYNYDFVDASTAATSWQWDFGDGNTANSQNANHTFANAGSYNVCLAAANACGTDTFCQTINVCPNIPNANYNMTPNGLNQIFSNVSSGSPTSYVWDFGDGTTSTSGGTINHPFPSNGTYTVCLVATNGCGSDTLCQNIVVNCPLPVAAWNQTAAGLSYSFSNASTGALGLAWNFGDGTTSSLQNPTHVYTTEGNFTVCLIATSTCGVDTTCQTITVSCPSPGTSWTAQTTNLSANFTDASSNSPTSWAWNFGDGGTSILQNPTHVYASTGSKQVCLIATNSCGADTSCNTILISVADLENIGSEDFEMFPNPARDYFQIQTNSTGEINLSIYTLLGEAIANQSVSKDEKINLRNMPKGTYLILISNETNSVTRKLIIE